MHSQTISVGVSIDFTIRAKLCLWSIEFRSTVDMFVTMAMRSICSNRFSFTRAYYYVYISEYNGTIRSQGMLTAHVLFCLPLLPGTDLRIASKAIFLTAMTITSKI